MSIVESKSLLAKLLAEENISVQHRKTQTAYFDVKQRILVCPILKDMPSELYDLLMGHEVGHALFTPAAGWHDALKSTQSPGFRSYLNVVEDARIERKVKGKFPGIRPSFFKGYKNLFDRDFFGVKDKNLATLPLIDRINLHYKLGSMVNVSFNGDEQYFIDLIDAAESWQDVVNIAEELFDYAKEQQQQESKINMPDDLEFGEDGGEGDDDYEDFSASGLSDLDNDLDQDASDAEGDGDDDDGGAYDKFFEPSSITDTNFRKREAELVDEACIPINYAKVPDAILSKIVIPHKVVHDAIERACLSVESSSRPLYEFFEVSSKDFFEKNNRYINYLVKEFELRKNAKQFARASVNKTGELDMKKITKYKLTEDIFRRVTIVPQGKNHGLLLFIDLSGSMAESMMGTIEQLLILVSFCRKVNIPFEVYGFSDRAESYALLFDKNANDRFTQREGEFFINCSMFHLKQYFSSNMSRQEFNRAVLNMLAVGAANKRRYFNAIPTETLNGTPLDSAIIASIQIAENFRKSNRLEVLTTMFLTDGSSADSPTGVYGEKSCVTPFHNYITRNYNLNISHKSGHSVQISSKDPVTKGLLMLLKKVTNANVIGFFIGTPDRPYKSTVRSVFSDYNIAISDNSFDADVNAARKNKFFPIMGSGFDVFFVVPSGDEMIIKDRGISVGPNATKTEIRKAFMTTVKTRAVNRVFLSRFCNTLCQTL